MSACVLTSDDRILTLIVRVSLVQLAFVMTPSEDCYTFRVEPATGAQHTRAEAGLCPMNRVLSENFRKCRRAWSRLSHRLLWHHQLRLAQKILHNQPNVFWIIAAPKTATQYRPCASRCRYLRAAMNSFTDDRASGL